MTITYENLLWLKNTPLKNFVGLMEAVTRDMSEPRREQFIDSLWSDVAVMRHMRERGAYECKV